MTRYTLHVPARYNNGRPVTPHIMQGIESRLIDYAGGFTMTRADGAWRGDDGTIYHEPIRLYLVDTAEDISRQLHELAESVAIRLGQEAVYLTAQNITTSLVVPV